MSTPSDNPFGRRIEGWRASFRTVDQKTAPGDVPYEAWRQFLKDSAAFLGSDWAVQALGKGWDDYTLFAANRIKPWARIDHAGMLWLAHGQALAEMTEGYVRFAHGLTYSRTEGVDPDELALPWEFGDAGAP